MICSPHEFTAGSLSQSKEEDMKSNRLREITLGIMCVLFLFPQSSFAEEAPCSKSEDFMFRGYDCINLKPLPHEERLKQLTRETISVQFPPYTPDEKIYAIIGSAGIDTSNVEILLFTESEEKKETPTGYVITVIQKKIAYVRIENFAYNEIDVLVKYFERPKEHMTAYHIRKHSVLGMY
jgi:hypothetical protein